MTANLPESDLEAYLDEALASEEMARIEKHLRSDREALARLSVIQARRNAGVHSVGEIWRRHRLSCPNRQQLGSLLLDALPPELADYIRFHVEVSGCRWCEANLADLRNQQAESRTHAQTRRQKYFQSSAGYLKGRP
jgi:hypothetical protein